MKYYHIYGLRVKGRKKFFYIGCTSQILEKRMIDHYRDKRENVKEKRSIIMKYKSRIEIVHILSIKCYLYQASQIELSTIKRFLLIGHPLVNKKGNFKYSKKS